MGEIPKLAAGDASGPCDEGSPAAGGTSNRRSQSKHAPSADACASAAACTRRRHGAPVNRVVVLKRGQARFSWQRPRDFTIEMAKSNLAPRAAPSSAPLARRFAALAYEAVLYSALILIAGFLTIPLVPAAAPGEPGLRIPDLPAKVLSFALVFGIGALYYAWSWTGGRRTLPMKTWRLTLVRIDRTAPDGRTALVRYFAGWIGPALALLGYVALRKAGHGTFALGLIAFNYLWAFADPDRCFLHDRLAGTRIVVQGPA